MEEWKNKNAKRIKRLKNKHKGERCFILGNSPSLNKVDFSLIRDEILFGTNALFMGTEKFGITPKYWAITNLTNWKAWSSSLQKLNTKLFVGGLAMKEMLKTSSKMISQENIYLIPQLDFMWKDPNNFSTDLSKGAYNGDSIIIDICLQAAYYMGFNEIYLLGIDLDFSKGYYFYEEDNKKLDIPLVKENLVHVLPSYEICKKFYEIDNRKIFNATIGGKLKVFPRKRIEDIIGIKENKIKRKRNNLKHKPIFSI